jgi:chromosome segregation ATPase
MSTATLKTLTIEHLRGAVAPFSLRFEKGKKLTIIYGENGAGKSTICDAFELLGSGTVGSLDDRGLGKTERYWHSVGKTAGDVAVTLETTTGASWRATIGRNGVLVTPAAGRPRVEVLRRSRILSLWESTPGERYEAIRRFVDVSNIEAAEAFLRDAIKSLRAGRDLAAARIQEVRDTIEQFWKQGGSPGNNAFDWAAQEASRDLSVFDLEIVALETVQRCYERLSEGAARIEAAERDADAVRTALRAAEATLAERLEQAPSDAADVVQLLEAAQAHLSKHEAPSACPLCESAERVVGLAERVSDRLEAFAELKNAQAAAQAKRGDAERAAHRLNMLEVETRAHASELAGCIASNGALADTPLPHEPVPDDPNEWAAWLGATSRLPAEWRQASARRQDNKKFRGTLRAVLEGYDDQLREQRELDVLLPRLQKALEIVADERRRFTDETLLAIAADVGQLYEKVHPGEGLNQVSLALDRKRRASLEIEATFCGQEGLPPQAYFSDSHLDTLALCVFLALSGRAAPADTILVLDDLLASVDEPHVDRLIEMLYEETAHFRHCILTTHYRPWKEKYRWGWLKAGHCHFVELTKWSVADGLKIIRSVPELQRLRQMLVDPSPDLQSICAKAGVILEQGLDFLTTLYRCSVPRNVDGRYTLGDLLPAVDGRLRKALEVEILTGTDAQGQPLYTKRRLAPHLEALTKIMQVRNIVGCHFNDLSYDLIDADALTFGRQVLELMEALTDESVGWPKSDKSGRYWATPGETRRLHPLRKPS